MSYVNAEQVLPQELIEEIQRYAEGRIVYIPKRMSNRQARGKKTPYQVEIQERNRRIYKEYRNGIPSSDLARKYFLSLKSIQRILLQEKRSVKR